MHLDNPQLKARFEQLMAQPDPPDLRGVLPYCEPRGHRITQPGAPDRLLTVWPQLVKQWVQVRAFRREEHGSHD